MSSTKALSVRPELLLRSGNLSRLTWWWVTADRLLQATSTLNSKSLMYKLERQTLHRSRDTGMQSARSGDCVLPPAGARRCEVNHRGIEGEDRALCARVRRWREEHTLVERQSWGPSNHSGLMMVNWESQSKGITISPHRVQKTDTLIVFYLFVLYSVTCLKICHFTACFTPL